MDFASPTKSAQCGQPSSLRLNAARPVPRAPQGPWRVRRPTSYKKVSSLALIRGLGAAKVEVYRRFLNRPREIKGNKILVFISLGAPRSSPKVFWWKEWSQFSEHVSALLTLWPQLPIASFRLASQRSKDSSPAPAYSKAGVKQLWTLGMGSFFSQRWLLMIFPFVCFLKILRPPTSPPPPPRPHTS